ncbi:MAG TPA: hypothetical protein ENJ05_00680, partial [Thiotrichales bacterium]|nr:hypothetical protein [Thiotrichales bacterium]
MRPSCRNASVATSRPGTTTTSSPGRHPCRCHGAEGDLDEFGLIDRFFAAADCGRGDVRLGIGDDAALLTPRPGELLVAAVDTLVEGVHFPSGTLAEAIGYKALAVNLSDLAAMGAEP